MAKGKETHSSTEAKIRPTVEITTPSRTYMVSGFEKGWTEMRKAGTQDGWPVVSRVTGWERID